MTSRRKQFKPTKSSVASLPRRENQLEESNTDDVSTNVPVTSIENEVEKNIANETVDVEVSEIPQNNNENNSNSNNNDNKSNSNSNEATPIKVNDIKIEIDDDEINKNIGSFEGIEEINRKVHKDDAKILPFDSNGGVEFFRCPLCNDANICGRESLTIHLQSHQNKTKRDDGKHLCCLCSKELSSNSSLERHLLTHSNHRPFSCTLCDKKFTTNGNLSRHIKTSHNSTGSLESSIDEILRKHHPEPPKERLETPPNYEKYKRPVKPVKKEMEPIDPLCMKVSYPDTSKPCTVRNIESISSDTPQFSSLIPLPTQNTNFNFLPPFLSFNVNDLSTLFHRNLFDKPNSVHQNPIPFNPFGNVGPTLNVNQSKFETKLPKPTGLATKSSFKSKVYFRRITYHMKRLRRIRLSSFNTCSSGAQCLFCGQRFLKKTLVLKHIKKCYSNNVKNRLFCVVKECSKKFLSRKKLLKHIKDNHMQNVSIHESDLSSEPLNLSMKNYEWPSAKIGGDVCNLTRCRSFENSERNSPNYRDHMMLGSGDFSDMTAKQSMSKAYNIHIAPLCSANQFISNRPIIALPRPQQPISIPLKHESNPNLSFTNYGNSAVSSLPFLYGNKYNSDKNFVSKTGLSELNNCSKFSRNNQNNNNTETSSLSSSNHEQQVKYSPPMVTKKKNSYKDAPKLITCPMNGCVQKFPWNSSLMRHILTHTAHKPFKCTRCTKSFSTKSNRERHMTRVHGVRINRSKLKSLQATRIIYEDASKNSDESSERNNHLLSESKVKFSELSEEEWMLMDNSDRQAEDISTSLLKLAGQPLVEPNPVRLNNQIQLISAKPDYTSKTHLPSNDSGIFY